MQSNFSKADQAIVRLGLPSIHEAINHLCKTDFLVFQKVELGFEIGPHHIRWAERLKTGLDVCEMAPRDHGKSLSLARAYPLWKAKYDPWVKDILLLGADQPSAVENLDKIKQLLADRPSMRHLLPKSTRDTINSRTEMRLSNGITIKAKGVGSPLRGRHPQLIVLDDVLNERNSLLPEHRTEMRNYFNEVVVPMKDKGLKSRKSSNLSQIVVIGTAQDKEDLYHYLISNPEYIGEKMAAIIDDDNKIVLWPDRYSYDDLMSIKRKVGALSFSKEYLNKPITEETSLFPQSLFEQLKDRELSYVNSYSGGWPVYMGVDFSVPGSMDGDWTVVWVMAMDPSTQTFIPLNYWRAQPQQMQEQLHKIELWCQMYNVTLGYLEDNLFQRVYANVMQNKSALPLRGHTVTHGNKISMEYGILSFRPLFENGKFRFPYKTVADQQKTDHIITEFNGIVQRKGRIGNESYHDDVILAMWHAMMCARQAGGFSVSWD